MPNPHISSKSLTLTLILSLGLASCDFSNDPNCIDYFSSNNNDFSSFLDPEGGLITTLSSNIYWSRCPAGQAFSSPDACTGEAIYLNFQEANSYAQDLSDKSGRSVRLPTRQDFDQITEDRCINPAVNTNIFPSMITENFWTSSSSAMRSNLACTYYSYKGSISCLEPKDIEHPFLIVIDKQE